jgi:murein DD-endopeptidase MepM/ murein hydrolase activator NlpD
MVKDENYTIVIFPGMTGSPKTFTVGKKFISVSLISALVFVVGISGLSYFFGKKYFNFVGNTGEVSELRRDAKVRKIKVEELSQRIKNFESKMARLERFENKLRVITALEDSPKSIEKNWGLGGPYGLTTNSYTTILEKGAASMVERLHNELDQLDRQAKIETISFQELDEFFKSQKSLLSSTPSIWPTRGWVTSSFGFRKSPFTGLREKHDGWDIGARLGSNVRVTADGIVVVAGREHGYGKLVEIDHGYGIVTRYGHNSKNIVKVGDRVQRGQKIALVGNTGRSTGPHLHYEVRLHGVPVNPKNYILED